MEQLIEHGPGDIAGVFARAFELAMQIQRERFLGVGHYERTQTTAARDAAPASWGAHGAARGSSIAETLDPTNSRRHQEPTLGSVISQ